jgi:hypothetical protein
MTQREAIGGWHISEDVHPLLHDGGMVYINSKTGMWGVAGRRVGAVMLSACGALEDVDLNWRELQQDDSHFPQILGALEVAGLVVAGEGPNPPLPIVIPPDGIELSDAGIISTARPLAAARPIAGRLEVAAQQNLNRALRLIHQEPFPVLLQEIQDARGPNVVPATASQALAVAEAVYQVSDWHLGKFACLEHSTATVLVGAQEGLHIDLQFGASVDPIEYHAWPVAEGQPVTLSHETPVAGRFHPVFTV